MSNRGGRLARLETIWPRPSGLTREQEDAILAEVANEHGISVEELRAGMAALPPPPGPRRPTPPNATKEEILDLVIEEYQLDVDEVAWLRRTMDRVT